MSVIAETFARCRGEKRAAFIPFLTGGDPDLHTSSRLIEGLVEGGADLIEIGVPFSDPIADGPVNQQAATRALAAGTTLSGILELVAQHKSRSAVPVVLFSYFNPLLVGGVETFAEQAAESGVDGVLCVDLPPEEARSEYIPALRREGLDTVFLLAPTSTSKRIREVGDSSTGFVYYVSRTGVTGTRESLTADLKRNVRRVRRRLKQPLAVGFGISTPEQVESVGRMADGVVVGSALVDLVAAGGEPEDLVATVRAEALRLSAPLRSRSSTRS